MTAAPTPTAISADGWTTAWAKAEPERVPTPARKSTIPNWRRVRFGRVRQLPDEGPGAGESSEEQADHERAARVAEREAAAARQRERNGSEGEPGRDPDAEAERVDLAERAERVAEEAGDLPHPRPRGDDPDRVAELEVQVRLGDEVDVAAAQAGRGRLEAVLQLEVADSPSGDGARADDDPPEVELVPVELDLLRRAPAELTLDEVDLVGGAHDGQQVARHRLERAGGRDELAVPLEAAEAHRAAVPIAQLVQRPGALLHEHRADEQGSGTAARAAALTAQHRPDDEERQHDAERVREREADERVGGEPAEARLPLQRLERGREGGRVRLAAREGAGGAGPCVAERRVGGERDERRGGDRAHDDARSRPAPAAASPR